MADGGYYKGTFVNGEIQGHGFRLFGLNGCTYTGEFYQGEMNGQGIYKTPQGLHYEGNWLDNKREGHGVLTESNGSLYDGSFHNHKRHGKGMQIYHNGDRYEGEWVQDKKQGQGILRTADGTIYDGQWLSDVYHGQGTMFHCSGMVYTGLWSNGSPNVETAQLKMCGSQVLKVVQDRPFSITLQCYDENGEPTNLDNGRRLMVTAAYCMSKEKLLKRSMTKLSIPIKKSGEALSAMFTPFGEGFPYELLQRAEVEESKPATPTSSRAISISHSETGSGSSPTTTESQPITSEGMTAMAMSMKSKSISPDKNLALRALRDTSPLAAKSMYTLNKPPPDLTESEAFLNTLVPPRVHYTKEGKVTFTDLFFPPPFLPLIQSESSSVSSDSPNTSEDEREMKRKAAELQARKSPHLSPLHSTSQRLPVVKKKDGQPQKSRSPVKSAKTRSPRTPPSPQKSPSKARKKDTDKSPPRKSPERKLSRKEELLQPKRDRHCWLGTYVLIFADVTEPPFFDKRLPKCYCKIQVVSSSKEQVQEEKTRMEQEIQMILQPKKPRQATVKKLRKSVSNEDNKK
ncbi:MORN repeat-containing protein 1-like isoform X2 [Dysidea avara]